MKKYLSLLICFLVALCAYAQDAAGIFYDGAPIPHSRVIGQSMSNIAESFFSMGLINAKFYIQIEGENSDLIISDRKPEFKVTFNPEFKKYGSMFSNAENMDYLVLVSVKKSKNIRQMQTSSYVLFGMESKVSDKKIIPLRVDENGDGTFTITPKKELKPGEYVFWFTKRIPDGEQVEGQKQKTKPYNFVFDFTVKK